MAYKGSSKVEAAVPTGPLATFRMDGVRYTDADKSTDGTLLLTLEVKPLSVDWQAIRQYLTDGGIDHDRANDYVAKIAEKIECEEMAAFIADRLHRIR